MTLLVAFGFWAAFKFTAGVVLGIVASMVLVAALGAMLDMD